MREIFRYLLVTIGLPLLIVAILNKDILVELGKAFKLRSGGSLGGTAAETVGPDRLFIPRLNVVAPLILSSFDPTDSWENLRRDLENGVSLAPGLAKPGQDGTVFITGHSSDYAWRPGGYKTVFALLPLLKEGDEIVIDYQGQRFKYKITGNRVVDPKEVSAFSHRGGKTLTLMTCYPPLTTAKRWLVYAEEI